VCLFLVGRGGGLYMVGWLETLDGKN
jgi:hypothetical protein